MCIFEGGIDAPDSDNFCKKGWLPVLNLKTALRGVDLPRKTNIVYNRKDRDSVSWDRDLIFKPTERDKDYKNYKKLDFLGITSELSCDVQFTTQSWTTLAQYIRDASYSTMTKWNLGFSNQKTSFFGSIRRTIPPDSFGASGGMKNIESNADMEYFFKKQHGSISRSSAKCTMYRVDVDINHDTMQLSPGFVVSIRKLDKVLEDYESKARQRGSRASKINQSGDTDWSMVEKALKKFMSNYGTHYAYKFTMGFGVDFETRYTETEKKNHKTKTRNKCAEKYGQGEIFGANFATDSTVCSDIEKKYQKESENRVKRFVAQTYGTLPGKSGCSGNDPCVAPLADWTKVALEQYQSNTLSPRPIKQEFAPIFDIFETEVVANIKKNEFCDDLKEEKCERINITLVKKHVKDAYVMYDLYFATDMTYEFACAKTIKLKNTLYHRATGISRDRRYYKDEFGRNNLHHYSTKSGYFRYWAVSQGCLPCALDC